MNRRRSRSPVPPWHPTNFGWTQEQVDRALKGKSKGKGKGCHGNENGDTQSSKGGTSSKGYGKRKGKGGGKDKGLGGTAHIVWDEETPDEEEDSSYDEEEQREREARAEQDHWELFQISVREIVKDMLVQYGLIPPETNE